MYKNWQKTLIYSIVLHHCLKSNSLQNTANKQKIWSRLLYFKWRPHMKLNISKNLCRTRLPYVWKKIFHQANRYYILTGLSKSYIYYRSKKPWNDRITFVSLLDEKERWWHIWPYKTFLFPFMGISIYPSCRDKTCYGQHV